MAQAQLVVLLSLWIAAFADRRGAEILGLESTGNEANGVLLEAGAVIDGQYEVVHEVENLHYGYGNRVDPVDGNNRHLSLLETRGSLDNPMPSIEGYEDIKTLGENSHARAYLVKDWTNEGQFVVLKLIHSWENDRVRRNTHRECHVMMFLHKTEHVQADPVGASRLMRCLKNNVQLDLQEEVIWNHRHKKKPDGRLDFAPKYVDPGPQYIILEWGLGSPLRVGEDHKVAGPILKQLLQGVRYMAGLGVQHRGLKPNNILVSFVQDQHGESQPIIKIMDFGLASYDVFCEQARFNTDSCTFDYSKQFWSPPEWRHSSDLQLLRKTYPSIRVDSYDLWSVGLTIVAAICPAPSESDAAALMSRQQQWSILLQGLDQNMDYDAFFCGTGGHVDKHTLQTYPGFWPTICHMQCETFYANNYLKGISEFVMAVLQRDPQKRTSFYNQMETVQFGSIALFPALCHFLSYMVSMSGGLVLDGEDYDSHSARCVPAALSS